MVVAIIMIFYIYALIGMEFLNAKTNPPLYLVSQYNPEPYSNFENLPMSLLTLF